MLRFKLNHVSKRGHWTQYGVVRVCRVCHIVMVTIVYFEPSDVYVSCVIWLTMTTSMIKHMMLSRSYYQLYYCFVLVEASGYIDIFLSDDILLLLSCKHVLRISWHNTSQELCTRLLCLFWFGTDQLTHTLQGYFTGTGVIIALP